MAADATDFAAVNPKYARTTRWADTAATNKNRNLPEQI
jgi:hypothetical protein